MTCRAARLFGGRCRGPWLDFAGPGRGREDALGLKAMPVVAVKRIAVAGLALTLMFAAGVALAAAMI